MKGCKSFMTSEVINKSEINDEVIAFLAKVLGPLIEEEFRKEDAKDV